MLRMISDAVPTMTNRSKPECHPGHPMLLETCSGMCPAERNPNGMPEIDHQLQTAITRSIFTEFGRNRFYSTRMTLLYPVTKLGSREGTSANVPDNVVSPGE